MSQSYSLGQVETNPSVYVTMSEACEMIIPGEDMLGFVSSKKSVFLGTTNISGWASCTALLLQQVMSE
jgi:hypothetical protein